MHSRYNVLSEAMMYGLGNNDKVLGGVVENYPLFGVCSETAQWIECFDRLKHAVGAHQHWRLLPTFRS